MKYLNQCLILVFALSLMLAVFVPTLAAQDEVSLSIPSLNIEANIIKFPLNGTGWDMHPWEGAVGHLQGTAWFGETGNIALGGHSTLPDFSAGVFIALNQVQIGEAIIVIIGGQEQHYSVSGITQVRPDDLSILYPTADERLTLITCDPNSYDSASESYLRRIVVVANRIR